MAKGVGLPSKLPLRINGKCNILLIAFIAVKLFLLTIRDTGFQLDPSPNLPNKVGTNLSLLKLRINVSRSLPAFFLLDTVQRSLYLFCCLAALKLTLFS